MKSVEICRFKTFRYLHFIISRFSLPSCRFVFLITFAILKKLLCKSTREIKFAYFKKYAEMEFAMLLRLLKAGP